jgi:hypothetical protein
LRLEIPIRETPVPFVKRLVLWLFLSLPVGMLAGAVFSAFLGDNAAQDRFTAAGNGVLAGAWTGVIGAFAAAATTTISRARLKEAGGSQFLTGLFVSFGLIVAALLLLLVG